eukprot:NODE_985_length_2788_cov_1.010413.p3 type:complete len:108 gc:universal NODE_985_length_2788_cov_1.010413:1612-1289(-)
MTSDGRYCLSIYKLYEDSVNYSLKCDLGKGLIKLKTNLPLSQIQLVGDNLFGLTNFGVLKQWDFLKKNWIDISFSDPNLKFLNFFVTETHGKDFTTFTIYGNERITQ